MSVILVVACLPSLLVFGDRWLGDQSVNDLLMAIWCRLPSACLGPWPPAILLIVPAALAAVFLVALRPTPRSPLEPRPLEEGVAAPPPATLQRRLATVALAGSALALLGVLVSDAVGGTRPGWDYAILYLAFLSACMLTEITVGRALAAALALWRGWAGPLAAHILLVLTLFTSVDRSPAAPALAILAVSAHILLWRTRRSTITPAFWLISLSLVLTSLYFRAWWFSAIGDEYGFYTFAAGLLAHADLTSIGAQLYNPSGVYTTHPGFSSLIQVASMAVFGPGLFGWRFSNLYLAALSLWPFYIFVEVIGGRRLAILAGALLAISHYLMSFGKIGYNNLQALFSFSLCLAAATWFIRSRGRLAAVAFGAALGLSFFVYPGAILTLPVALLFAAQHRPRRAARGRWWIVGVCLLATALPLLLQVEFWQTKLAGTPWQDPSLVADWASTGRQLLRNLAQASLSFLITASESHFVAVGFLDMLSAVLVLLGFGALLRSRNGRPGVFLLASLAILLILVGAFHSYPSPPPTRMFLLLPWLAVLGGLGLLWLELALHDLGGSELTVRRVTDGLLGLIMITNLVQAYPLSRLRMADRYQSPQVLLLREAGHLLDAAPARARLLILAMPESPLRESVALQLRLHQVPFDDAALTEDSALVVSDEQIQDPHALILIAPRVLDGLRSELEARLVGAGKSACHFRSSIGEVRLVVWAAAAERYRCAEAAYHW
ncbi:MAG TPA: glycosyltransferase family 39 protein [Anaerolineales bacterium]|nr:glycosyltransferase family 39 protein [Anaerolineales bacterium]